MNPILSALLVLSSIARADVRPVERDDLNLVRVGQDEQTANIKFELCDLSPSDFQTILSCRPLGRSEGYTLAELKQQRWFEKGQAVGLWTAGAVTVVGSVYLVGGVGFMVGALASGPGSASPVLVWVLPAVGGAGVAGGSYSLFKYVDALNPVNQGKDAKVLDQNILDDQDVSVPNDTSVYEFAMRLQRILEKLN